MSARLKGVLVPALACVALCFVPAPKLFDSADGAQTRVARVVEVDSSGVEMHELVAYGTERLKVELDGKVYDAENELRAQMDLDKRFKPGDRALVSVPPDGPGGSALVALDHWRIPWIFALFAAFAALLVWFGGWVGAKALFSFAFGCLAVWKLLVPLLLAGWPASPTVFVVVAVLTAVIMHLVAGFTRTGFAAFAGAMLGVVASLALSHFFTRMIEVNGATMPFSQALVYSGCERLDLRDLCIGAVVLASSGAVMDLAMDIASGVAEVVKHSPSLGFRELLGSGLRIGRAVVGTMTTTLLLAYSGGFLTLLMVFAAKGTPPVDFLNSTLVSAEVVKTLVGSFGLVLVAPFTAMVSAATFTRGRGKLAEKENGQ